MFQIDALIRAKVGRSTYPSGNHIEKYHVVEEKAGIYMMGRKIVSST